MTHPHWTFVSPFVFPLVSAQRGQLRPGSAASVQADQADDLLVRRRERRV